MRRTLLLLYSLAWQALGTVSQQPADTGGFTCPVKYLSSYLLLGGNSVEKPAETQRLTRLGSYLVAAPYSFSGGPESESPAWKWSWCHCQCQQQSGPFWFTIEYSVTQFSMVNIYIIFLRCILSEVLVMNVFKTKWMAKILIRERSSFTPSPLNTIKCNFA